MYDIIVLILLIITFIVLVILSLNGTFSKSPALDQSYIVNQANESLSQALGWTTPTGANVINSEGVNLGQCRVYNTVTLDYESNKDLPSTLLNSAPTGSFCLDGLTQALSLVQNTCTAPTGCIGVNGDFYPQNSPQLYFKTCGNLQQCTNELTSIVFDYQVSGSSGVIEGTPTCVLFNSNQETQPTEIVNTVGCGSRNINEQILMNVDQNSIGNGVSYVRVRFPGTSYCLADGSTSSGESTNLAVAVNCSTLPNSGFVWMYNPPLNINQPVEGAVEPSKSYLPSSLCLIPPNGIPSYITFSPQNSADQKNLEEFASSLRCIYDDPRSSLPPILPFQFCNAYTLPCTINTGLVPASLWQQIGT